MHFCLKKLEGDFAVKMWGSSGLSLEQARIPGLGALGWTWLGWAYPNPGQASWLASPAGQLRPEGPGDGPTGPGCPGGIVAQSRLLGATLCCRRHSSGQCFCVLESPRHRKAETWAGSGEPFVRRWGN